jgi:transcriptional regulator with XRE-family HTH domain
MGTACDEVADMANEAGQNLRRLMAKLNLTFDEVCRQSGLDKRTVNAFLEGKTRPRPQTIHQLAKGLGVSTEEFFLDPSQLLYRHFDRQTNPVVDEIVSSQPKLFKGWTSQDFDELNSRHATGGPMTAEGVLDAVHRMNRNRQLHEKLSVLLETGQGHLIAGMLEAAYRLVVLHHEPPE